MNGLDLVILIILLADIARGTRIGFSRQFFGFAGFWGGLFLAALLAPTITRYGHSEMSKLILILVLALGIASLLSGLGERLGITIAGLVARYHGRPIDAVLGGVFGGMLVCLTVWVLAAMLLNVPQPGISQAIQGSRIVRTLDAAFPPAPPVIARIQRLIDPNGFPQVFLGPEPAPGLSTGVATTAEVTSAVASDRNSVVKIQGIGCGGEVFGSGFVADNGLVVTNAHVVAGIRRPLVLDAAGVHSATPVVFDPNLDVAVLRTSISEPALATSTVIQPRGTHVVALGYPGGRSFTASPASVIQSYVATGRNIYDAGITARRIYELDAVVQEGNSGGPLVLPDGTVVGLVFARSANNSSVGYALTLSAVADNIHAAQSRNGSVATGQCAAE